MTTGKKILFGIIAFLVVATPCITGYLYGFRQGLRAGGVTTSMAEVWLTSEHYGEQLQNANCEGAKDAILKHLSMIEKYRNTEGSIISGAAYYGDKMLDHTRLSLIEARMGNEQAAKKHMTVALEACKGRKWKVCSEERLLYFERKIEEKNPIACLSTEKR